MIKGTIHRFGHNLNSDVIHPPDYFSLDKGRVREGLMKGVDPTFLERFREHDIIVAGENFGCGSSRETTIYSMLHNKVGAVVALSFSRIFFRNAVNNLLPVFEFIDKDDYERLSDGVKAEIAEDDGSMMCEGRRIELLGVPTDLKAWLEFRASHEL
jgi:3-isopropylmalate/(R)-2-methylmalate dehydratase small subunit